MKINTYMQWQQFKNDYPNALILMDVGNFYELFGLDAYLSAPVLKFKLSGRGIGEGKRIPMVGMPKEKVDNYIGILQVAGFDVVVTEMLAELEPKNRVRKRRMKAHLKSTASNGKKMADFKSEYEAFLKEDKLVKKVLTKPRGEAVDQVLAAIEGLDLKALGTQEALLMIKEWQMMLAHG